MRLFQSNYESLLTEALPSSLRAQGNKRPKVKSRLYPLEINRPKESGSSDIFHIFKHEVRLSGVRASISSVHIRKFYEMQ